MGPQDPRELEWLDRYLAGEGRPDERAQWRRQIEGDPALQQVASAIQKNAGSAPPSHRPWDVDRAWSATTDKRKEPERGALVSTSLWMHRSRWWIGVAAAGLVLCAVLLTVRAPGARLGRTYVTAAGERTRIKLVDGTQLILAPESRLQVGGDYGRGARQVTLVGEAYFSVVHDVWHPFAVLTHNIQINDVGTEFDVRAYPEDNETRVAVTLGAVALVGAGRGNGAMRYSGGSFDLGTVSRTRPSSQETPLSAGDIAIIHNGIPSVTHDANIASATAWIQGQLAFDKTPLRDVVHDISRTFGVQVTIADSSLLGRRVTATLSGESLDVVLDIVTHVVGARFERTANGVVIHSGMAGASTGEKHINMRSA